MSTESSTSNLIGSIWLIRSTISLCSKATHLRVSSENSRALVVSSSYLEILGAWPWGEQRTPQRHSR